MLDRYFLFYIMLPKHFLLGPHPNLTSSKAKKTQVFSFQAQQTGNAQFESGFWLGLAAWAYQIIFNLDLTRTLPQPNPPKKNYVIFKPNRPRMPNPSFDFG